jgi:hypothetical protein
MGADLKPPQLAASFISALQQLAGSVAPISKSTYADKRIPGPQTDPYLTPRPPVPPNGGLVLLLLLSAI